MPLAIIYTLRTFVKPTEHVNLELSPEAFLLYLEISRKGVFASSGLLANMGPNVELFREPNFICIYGLMGRKD